MTTITGNEVAHYRLAVLRSAVRLEQKGMTRRGQSAKSIAIKELDLPARANHSAVIEALTDAINKKVLL